jgi:hypothetical protein
VLEVAFSQRREPEYLKEKRKDTDLDPEVRRF